MNVLFLTLLDFYSLDERGIYTDLMREFSKNGHDIYIISPTEKRKNENSHLIDNNNVQILKLQIGNTQKTNPIEKGISTLLLESQFKRGIEKYFNHIKFDLVLYSTPPITILKAVEYVQKRDNTKSYLLLKDIFPQNAVDLGMFSKKSFLYKYFKRKEHQLYKISDFIGTMSEANTQYVLKHNSHIKSDVVEITPNSISPIEINISLDKKNKIRNKFNIPNNKKFFIYGGNLGKPQGIDFLMECIKENEKNTNSFFVIVGSGTEYNKLKDYFDNNNFKNSMLLNQMPKKGYELLANSADVGMIFLDKRFTIPNFPSRLLSYMQAKMPVLSATDSNTDVGDVIEEGEFGYSCISDDVYQFNELVNKLAKEVDLEKMGQNAWDYLIDNYTTEQSYKTIMSHF